VRSDSISDSVTGFGDLYPQATLKWNQGVNNFMVYVMGDIPVGLDAALQSGHWSWRGRRRRGLYIF
jgi:hypothetical protein